MSAGQVHALAVDMDGVVYSWGSNHLGQLGRKLENTQYYWTKIPARVDGGLTMSGKVIVKVLGGYAFSVAMDTTGNLYGMFFFQNH